jgi:molybdopterin-guanine dinucleotide biosynthesis protein A
MSAFVLAGGASTRMGADKALLSFGGRTLLEHALGLLRELGFTPKIVAVRPDLAAYGPIVEDLRSGCGPLSGIEAGLLSSTSDLAVFLPVDLPMLPAALLRLLIERALLTGALATIPRLQGQPQPLVAVYHRALLPTISAALSAGDYKVMRVVQQAVIAASGAIDLFDLETVLTAEASVRGWPLVRSRALMNCNTPGDLARVVDWDREQVHAG